MTMLKREDMPQGVIDEINSHYKTVSWDNYGNQVTEDVRTRKLNYRKTIGEESTHTCVVMDPLTFETKSVTVVGTIQETYLVRAIFNEAVCDVYSVIPAGQVVA